MRSERVICHADVNKLRTAQIIKELLTHRPMSPVLRIILRDKNFTVNETTTKKKNGGGCYAFQRPL